MSIAKDKNRGLYLVTGSTGNVGRYLVDELIKKGHRVRALTRTPEKANLTEEADVVQGDLTEPDSLAPVFEGVTGIHLITVDGGTYKPLQAAPQLVELAVQAGVKKATVLWSGRQGPVEQAVKESPLEWTILQPQEFMSNMLGWAESIRENGVVQDGFASRKTALIHEGDIARAAATVLTEGGHDGKEYTLTGPETLTLTEAAHIIGDVTGHDVQFDELSEEQVRKQLTEVWQVDEGEADFITSWYKDTPTEGYTVIPTVEEITGRPARTFRQWAEEHASLFTEPAGVNS